MSKRTQSYKITTITGIALVVANMIGTGVFTSLGFQLKDLENPSVILMLWVLGGVIALSGAFSYAEIGTHIQKSGGEYAFLSKLFHPIIGYLSGWISITVGFAAPIALSAMAFAAYFPYFDINPKWSSILLIGLLTAIHTKSLNISSRFQNISTIFKVLLIVSLILIGLFSYPSSGNVAPFSALTLSELFSPAFAIALIYVSYSYSGWNAAAYIIEEFRDPKRSLPIALIAGTILVTVLYTLLHYVFLKHVPIPELQGQLDVGTIAANKMLGEYYGQFFGLAISLLLISGISAMIWVGSRVTSSIAEDYRLWRIFKSNENSIPDKALWFQFTISVLLIISGTFEQILIYCGVLLTLSAMITVAGVFKLRRQRDDIQTPYYQSPFFPVFQIVFIMLSVWIIVYAFIDKPLETSLGFFNIVLGLITYFWNRKLNTT